MHEDLHATRIFTSNLYSLCHKYTEIKVKGRPLRVALKK